MRITSRASIILIAVGALLMFETYWVNSYHLDYYRSGLALVAIGIVLIAIDAMLYLKSRISKKPPVEQRRD